MLPSSTEPWDGPPGGPPALPPGTPRASGHWALYPTVARADEGPAVRGARAEHAGESSWRTFRARGPWGRCFGRSWRRGFRWRLFAARGPEQLRELARPGRGRRGGWARAARTLGGRLQPQR